MGNSFRIPSRLTLIAEDDSHSAIEVSKLP